MKKLKTVPYEGSLIKISEISKFITIYELITVLLIIGAGLCGISEIAKNKGTGISRARYRGFWGNYLTIDYLRAINHSGIASADRVIFIFH